MKPIFIIPAILALGLASCAKDGDAAARKKSVSVGRFGVRYNTVPGAPGATAVPEAPAEAVKKPAEGSKPIAADATPSDDPSPVLPTGRKGRDEGMRLPNMLGLPEDRDLKATNPSGGTSKTESGGVISRPPVEKKD